MGWVLGVFPNYLTFWRNTYSTSMSDNLAERDGCQLCHWTTNAAWNSYGNALTSLLQGGFPILAAFTLVEGNDSDQEPGQTDNLSESLVMPSPVGQAAMSIQFMIVPVV